MSTNPNSDQIVEQVIEAAVHYFDTRHELDGAGMSATKFQQIGERDRQKLFADAIEAEADLFNAVRVYRRRAGKITTRTPARGFALKH